MASLVRTRVGRFGLTDVGKFIRETLADGVKLSNAEVAERVIHHFPEQTFNILALRQRVANFKYLEKKQRTVRIVTNN